MHSRSPLLFTLQKSLGSLETDVMEIVWKNKTMSVRNVVYHLLQEREIAYTTVMTVMDNLYKKGFLQRQKIKKSYMYSFAENRDHCITDSILYVFIELMQYKTGFILAMLFASSFFVGKKLSFRLSPIGYGLSFIFSLGAFIFSFLDTQQKMVILGTLDYLRLAVQEPGLFLNSIQLFFLAVFDTLPIVSIIITLFSLAITILLGRKLAHLASQGLASQGLALQGKKI